MAIAKATNFCGLLLFFIGPILIATFVSEGWPAWESPIDISLVILFMNKGNLYIKIQIN
jgi:hypothetical protein